MENLNAVNDAQQAAVEPAETATEAESGTDAGTPAEGTEAGAAPRGQSRAENRTFAQLRREKEASDAAASKLISGLQGLGFTGSDPDELLLQLEAKNNNLTVEQLRRQKSEAKEAVKNSPEYKSLEQQILSYGREKDLQAVREIDANVNSLDELGADFFKLRAAGVDAKTAYFAIKQAAKPAEKPESIGKVDGTGGVEGEYFTSEQLDRLTDKDLSDPKIYEKAIRSLSRI